MSVTLEDILENVRDHTAAQTGQVKQDREIRNINRAVEYFQRKITFPSDEDIYEFFWSDDQLYYDLPSDFMEQKQLLFDDNNENTYEEEWNFKPSEEILRDIGDPKAKNRWSVVHFNGKPQLLLVGTNQQSGDTISDFDTVGDWEVADDASSLEQDLLQKKVGDGSLSFDITNSAGTATITNDDFSLNVKSLFENHGIFKFFTFLTDSNIDSIDLKLMVDGSNYWTITASEADDGTSFTANEWVKVGWPLDDATETGSPSISDKVTEIRIEWQLGSGFTSAVDFRADHLYTTVPDKMDLIYWSNYKAIDGSTGDKKRNLENLNDKLILGEDFPDVAEDVIPRRAALTLFPALRADKQWYSEYKDLMKESMRDHARRYPRKRTNNFLSTRLKR